MLFGAHSLNWGVKSSPPKFGGVWVLKVQGPGTSGEVLGRFGKLPGNLWIAVKFHRQLPGKSPKNFRGSSGNFWGSPGTSQKLGEPDSLPATRQICLQFSGVSGPSGPEITQQSGKKKEPKPKLFGPDVFGWGGGLPHEGVGAKKFGMSLETREIKLLSRDIPGFCRETLGRPKSLRKKSSCSILVP